MNDNNMKEKLEALAQDETFMKQILEMDTPEQVQAAFAQRGVDLSVEDILKARDLLAQHPDGELSEDQLENVSGGVIGLIIGIIVGSVLFSGAMMTIGTLSINKTKW